MLTIEQITDIIRDNKTPYVYLYYKRDFANSALAGKFECNTCNSEDSAEEKTEKAVSWLVQYVRLFPADTVFILKAKTSQTANQSGIIGPFEFSVNERKSNENQLTGLPDPQNLKQLGFVPEAELKARILEKELEFQRERHLQEMENLRKEFNAAMEYIKQAQQKWDPSSLAGLAKELKESFMLLTGKTPTSLAGVEKAEQPKAPKDILLQSITSELQQLEFEQIKLIKTFLNDAIKKFKSNEQTRTDTDTRE